MGQDRFKLGYRPSLDGLRGVAVLAVVAYHVGLPQHHLSGGRGVDVFFVLSGFLITTLLLDEKRDEGTIRLRAFYGRRIRRLAPALAVMLVAALAVAAVMPADVRDETAVGVLIAAAYVTNWLRLADVTTPDSLVGHTWSLSIEEQFYTAFPWIVGRVSARRLLYGTVAVVVVVTCWQFAVPHRIAYLSTVGRMDDLGVGVGLAAAAHTGIGWARIAAAVGRLRTWPLSTLVVLLVAPHGPDHVQAWITPVVLVVSGMVVVQSATGQAPKILESAWMVRAGRLSYSLYLWHQLVNKVVGEFVPDPAAAAITLTVSWGLAEASWRWVEQPLRARSVPRPAYAPR